VLLPVRKQLTTITQEIAVKQIRNTQLARMASITTIALMCFAAHAQAPDATCAKLLPPAKLQAVAGTGFVAADARSDKSGELGCAWMRRGGGGFATVSVQYYDKKTIARPDNSGSADELYENIITPHEQTSKAKREPILGVGKRAALVPADPQRLVAIVRDDGVLRIVMNGLTKAQAIAIARAVGAP
jgi:hypothetical protein